MVDDLTSPTSSRFHRTEILHFLSSSSRVLTVRWSTRITSPSFQSPYLPMLLMSGDLVLCEIITETKFHRVVSSLNSVPLPLIGVRKRPTSSHTPETSRRSRPESRMLLTSSEIIVFDVVGTTTNSDGPRRTNGKETSFFREDQDSTRVESLTPLPPLLKGREGIHR